MNTPKLSNEYGFQKPRSYAERNSSKPSYIISQFLKSISHNIAQKISNLVGEIQARHQSQKNTLSQKKQDSNQQQLLLQKLEKAQQKRLQKTLKPQKSIHLPINEPIPYTIPNENRMDDDAYSRYIDKKIQTPATADDVQRNRVIMECMFQQWEIPKRDKSYELFEYIAHIANDLSNNGNDDLLKAIYFNRSNIEINRDIFFELSRTLDLSTQLHLFIHKINNKPIEYHKVRSYYEELVSHETGY